MSSSRNILGISTKYLHTRVLKMVHEIFGRRRSRFTISPSSNFRWNNKSSPLYSGTKARPCLSIAIAFLFHIGSAVVSFPVSRSETHARWKDDVVEISFEIFALHWNAGSPFPRFRRGFSFSPPSHCVLPSPALPPSRLSFFTAAPLSFRTLFFLASLFSIFHRAAAR